MNGVAPRLVGFALSVAALFALGFAVGTVVGG
jgi:hypothetical protein